MPPLKKRARSDSAKHFFFETDEEEEKTSNSSMNAMHQHNESPDTDNYTPSKKYFNRRYRLFSRFDEGIQIDKEGWFSVTPEKIAMHHATRCKTNTIVDGFCGAGGNTIQFAKTCDHVIAVDIDAKKIEQAKSNARVYDVYDKIEFIVGDFLGISHSIHADGVFLSPPWGGPGYKEHECFDLADLSPNGTSIFEAAKRISNNIAMYLPRTIDAHQVCLLEQSRKTVEIESNYLDEWNVSKTVYFGNFVGYEG